MCNLSDRIEEKGREEERVKWLIKVFGWVDNGIMDKKDAIQELGLTEEEFDRKRAELLLNV